MPAVKWNVRVVAEQRGIRYATELAERAKININTANGLMNGSSIRVDRPTLAKLCQTLECTPGELLVYDPNGIRAPNLSVAVAVAG